MEIEVDGDLAELALEPPNALSGGGAAGAIARGWWIALSTRGPWAASTATTYEWKRNNLAKQEPLLSKSRGKYITTEYKSHAIRAFCCKVYCLAVAYQTATPFCRSLY